MARLFNQSITVREKILHILRILYRLFTDSSSSLRIHILIYSKTCSKYTARLGRLWFYQFYCKTYQIRGVQALLGFQMMRFLQVKLTQFRSFKTIKVVTANVAFQTASVTLQA